MKRVACLLTAAVCLTAAACGNPLLGPRACTAVLIYGLNVTVVDASTGERICDATVLAVDGTFTGTFERFGSPPACSYAGAPERRGTYEVRVTREGYQPAVARNVRVDADECHVMPVTLTIALAR
jgi:hypothetical protein